MNDFVQDSCGHEKVAILENLGNLCSGALWTFFIPPLGHKLKDFVISSFPLNTAHVFCFVGASFL